MTGRRGEVPLADLDNLRQHLLADERWIDHLLRYYCQVRPVPGSPHEQEPAVKPHHYLLNVVPPGAELLSHTPAQ